MHTTTSERLPASSGGTTAPPLRIVGRVVSPLPLTRKDLEAMDQVESGQLKMICGSGEVKGPLGTCRGVLLSDAINRAEVVITAHNDTKKMYVVVASDDGYKTVFSWQEIFNSENGDGIIIVLDIDGVPVNAESGAVDLISARDYLSGPRHVRKVSTIEIIMV